MLFYSTVVIGKLFSCFKYLVSKKLETAYKSELGNYFSQGTIWETGAVVESCLCPPPPPAANAASLPVWDAVAHFCYPAPAAANTTPAADTSNSASTINVMGQIEPPVGLQAIKCPILL